MGATDDRSKVHLEYIAPWKRFSSRERFEIQTLGQADHVFRQLRSGQFYEIDLLEHLGVNGPLGGVFIDVGAHIGNHTLFFARLLARHVVSIEPNAVVARVLRGNLAANRVHNVTLVEEAVADFNGVATLCWAAQDADNSGMARLIQHDRSEASAQDLEQAASVTTLDDLWVRVKPSIAGRHVRLIKIDVEGSEIAVLRGAAELIEQHQPQLVVELGTAEPLGEASEFLSRFGYRVAGRFCRTPTYHFVNPAVHALASRPDRRSGFPNRVLRSWERGRLARLRNLFGASHE
jgi:FkbM family methyltransferase